MNPNHQSYQDDQIDRLDTIQDGLSYLTGKSEVSIRELITDAFIVENTDFDTLANFFKEAGVKSKNDLEKPEFNNFIKSHTSFEDWEEMLIQASNKYAYQHSGG